MSGNSTKLLLLLAAVALQIASAAKANEQEPPRFSVSHTEIGDWYAEVVTELHWAGHVPSVTQVTCAAGSGDLSFTMEREGEIRDLHVRFQSPPDKDGDQSDATLLRDILWLNIDGYEVDVTMVPSLRTRLSNFDYSEADAKIPVTDILPLFYGFQGFRETENGQWIDTTRLFDRLLRAKKVLWGYRELHPDRKPGDGLLADWERGRYPVNVKGMRDVVQWCEDEMHSPAATRLPASLKGR